jgi:hypothetical protein
VPTDKEIRRSYGTEQNVTSLEHKCTNVSFGRMILLNVVSVLNSVTAFKRFRKTAKSDCYFHHVRLSSRNNSAPTERIFMKFNI